MKVQQIENFISGLISKTKDKSLYWKNVEKIDSWKQMKIQVQQLIKTEYKDYFLDDSKSYYVNKDDGYVMILKIDYSNAPIFSNALSKHLIVIKINDDFLPENLSAHGEQDFKYLLQELSDEIELQIKNKYNMPDCMYEFFDKILGEL